MKIIRQITKVIITPDDLKIVCINNKGNTLALNIEIEKRQELKLLVGEFISKIYEHVDKEIG